VLKHSVKSDAIQGCSRHRVLEDAVIIGGQSKDLQTRRTVSRHEALLLQRALRDACDFLKHNRVPWP